MAGGKYAAMDVLIDVALQSESIVGVCGNIRVHKEIIQISQMYSVIMHAYT